jgi:CHAD domain-containing protein
MRAEPYCSLHAPLPNLVTTRENSPAEIFPDPLASQPTPEVPKSAAKSAAKKAQPTGFGYWMLRVLEECERASDGFAADPVHDLRVSLRRCRSMADGLMAVDPDPAWKQMKKAGKRLFSSLGDLRDVQVMMEWVEKLGPPEDAETKALHELLLQREREHKITAAEALQDFDRKQWRKWAHALPPRAARIRKGSPIFLHLALERWNAAYDLHRHAMRSRSQTALHTLRIGIKRLRYIVENFLPQQHEAWGKDLKEMQDVLGEVHDFDVLWATALQVNAFPTAASRQQWRARIVEERGQRVARYRERMIGPASLWKAWRAELPQGEAIRQAGLMRMKLWASLLDPDFRHAQRVARFATQILDELTRLGLSSAPDHERLRRVLALAAYTHDVGLVKRDSGHHKKSARMLEKLQAPLGWPADELKQAAVVARFHRGALPHPRHKELHALPVEQRRPTIFLASILRLANAFDSLRDGHVARLRFEPQDGQLILWADGLVPMTRSAEKVSGARYLLETWLRRPIVVKPWVHHARPQTANPHHATAQHARAHATQPPPLKTQSAKGAPKTMPADVAGAGRSKVLVLRRPADRSQV